MIWYVFGRRMELPAGGARQWQSCQGRRQPAVTRKSAGTAAAAVGAVLVPIRILPPMKARKLGL